MTGVCVTPVASEEERRQFLAVPQELYDGDPHWVPPVGAAEEDLVGYGEHPFYETAEIQTFVAHRRGALCGRIAAIVNQAYNRWHGERMGFFGFFESIDDQAVAEALFDAASRWLTARGQQTMRGPVSPSITYQCGLLVEGFECVPTFLMPYNPPHLHRADRGERFLRGPGSAVVLGARADAGAAAAEARLPGRSAAAIARRAAAFRDVAIRPGTCDVLRPLSPDPRARCGDSRLSATAKSRYAARGYQPLTDPEMTAFAEVEGCRWGPSLDCLISTR